MKNCQKNLEKVTLRGEFFGYITDHIYLGLNHKLMIIKFTGIGAEVFRQAQAGQFVQVACGDFIDGAGTIKSGPILLRRPFSIAGVRKGFSRRGIGANKEDDILCCAQNDNDGDIIIYLEIIYRVVGPGTNWLAQQGVGAQINLLGPLGNGFTPPDDRKKKIILLGGGVGLPPLYYWADQLAQGGYKNVVGFAGAQRVNQFAGALNPDEYDATEPLKAQMVIKQWARSGVGGIAATDDGSFGFAGSVVAALEKFIDKRNDRQEAYLYACGPYGMLKAAAKLAERRHMACQVCMEAYMACGIGVCQSCVVPVRNKNFTKNQKCYKLVCDHGPVFDAAMIIWE